MPTLGGPGSNPKWFHETLDLTIGAHEYRFRTLDLYSVWRFWPHLAAIRTLMLADADRVFSMRAHAIPILEWIAPALAGNAEDCAALGTDQRKVNLVIDFYRCQDWARAASLGPATEKAVQRVENPKFDPYDVFVATVALGAQYCGMDAAQFVLERFEFCADQIAAAGRAIARANEAEEPERTWKDVWQALGQPRKLGDKAPAWLKKTSEVN